MPLVNVSNVDLGCLVHAALKKSETCCADEIVQGRAHLLESRRLKICIPIVDENLRRDSSSLGHCLESLKPRCGRSSSRNDKYVGMYPAPQSPKRRERFKSTKDSWVRSQKRCVFRPPRLFNFEKLRKARALMYTICIKADFCSQRCFKYF